MPAGTARLKVKGRANLVGEGARIKRKALGITLDALCGRIAHRTEGQWRPMRSDVHKIETGVRRVSDIEAYFLAVALGTTIAELVAVETVTLDSVAGGIEANGLPVKLLAKKD